MANGLKVCIYSNNFISSCYKRMKYIFSLTCFNMKETSYKTVKYNLIKNIMYISSLFAKRCICVCVYDGMRGWMKQENKLGLKSALHFQSLKIGSHLNVYSKIHIQADYHLYSFLFHHPYNFQDQNLRALHRQFPRKTRTSSGSEAQNVHS